MQQVELSHRIIGISIVLCKLVEITKWKIMNVTEETRLNFIYDLLYSRTYPQLRNIIILLQKLEPAAPLAPPFTPPFGWRPEAADPSSPVASTNYDPGYITHYLVKK